MPARLCPYYKIIARAIAIVLLWTFPLFLQGQEQTGNILLKKQATNWEQFVRNIEREYPIRIFFDSLSLDGFVVDAVNDSTSLEKVLKETGNKKGLDVSSDRFGNFYLFKGFKIKTRVSDLFIRQDQPGLDPKTMDEGINLSETDYIKTYSEYISENVTIGTVTERKNGQVAVRGKVVNQDDNKPIQQASLRIAEMNKTVVTDSVGNYWLSLIPGNYTLEVASLGMAGRSYKIKVLSDGQLNIPLKSLSFMLAEAEVQATRNNIVSNTAMGVERITEKAIRELPAMLGEKDVVKMVLLLPGVQTVGEISSGFNVRGSPADQNMFYINEVPVYNSSHLFGLYTSFNSDAISEFNFYKNSIPIEYGGQLSSIFDIDVKKGNNQYFTARGGIGPTSARVLAEGPFKKDGSSYLISLRSTYSDWILKQIDNPDIQNSSASFSDALIDFSIVLNPNNHIGLFFYGSTDYSNLSFGIKDNFSNLGAAMKWSHTFNKNFTFDLDLVKSRYGFNEENSEINYLANRHSFDLNHNEVKATLNLFAGQKHALKAGMDVKFYKLNFGDFLPLNENSDISPIVFEPEQALNTGIYISDTWNISPRFAIDGGVRGSLYQYLGPKTINQYEEGVPREPGNITGSEIFAENKVIRSYKNLDYKFSAKYEFSGNASVKAGYNRIHQYIFMMSNTISVSPISQWKLSDSYIKPMEGDQYSLGLYKNMMNKQVEASVEFYYKTVANLVEYKDGAEFITNRYPESNIIQGELKSYGVEWMLKKKEGTLNGWINYTFSRAEVKAFDPLTGEKNNQGLVYPANYDRPHALNLVFNYRATKRLSFSANVVYSTGRPITVPTSVYFLNEIEVTAFSKRNEYRLPDYFRTDLSINIEGNLKKYKFAHSSWSLSFYNLTARKNPYSMVFQNEGGVIKGYKISVLGTIIPTLTYNLKFGNYEN